jgi:tetratricopeptide (TPR) repeat protein
LALTNLERYQEALEAYQKALEINPDYQEALTDLNHAIDLDPEDDWSLYNRALVSKIAGHTDEVSNDLKNAIQLAKQSYEGTLSDWTNWRIAFNIALYHLVAEEFEAAETLYHRTLSEKPSRQSIHSAIRDLDKLLTMFPHYTHAMAMQQLLEKNFTNT